MKIEEAEFTEGKLKGFKYYVPVLENFIDITFLVKKEYYSDGTQSFDFIEEEQEQKILYWLNLSIKARVATYIQNSKMPKALGAVKSEKVFAEYLAGEYPTGFLNTREDILNNPPWKY